jgi:NAD(P)H dehydrogenase (quinone)
MYAILGLKGKVGGATARALLKGGKKVRGIVRDKTKAAAWEAAGVELAVADMSDVAAVESALRAVDGVFVMIPAYFAPAPGFPEARAVIGTLRKAIAAAQPPKVVYLSSIGAHRTHGLGLITQLHILEEEMGSLPIASAFVRPTWFLENYQWDAGAARERGEIDSFLSPLDRVFPMVAVEDIGSLAAKTVQQEWQGKRYLELEGPHRYSSLDAAAAFSRHLNRPVQAKAVPRGEWAAAFEKQGMPPDRTAPRIEMLEGFNSGWIDFERTGTEHVTGSTTMEVVFHHLLEKGA